ncbi:MAG: FAD-dependent oxidoreductase [Armatimonadetes bacterium]|nr:FAD-dependent oxidoreductase [Armatimonadota bacterium]
MIYDYDLIIIGAGSGGLTAANFAAKFGAKIALVEKHHIGGDCTWTGCVPSKALIKVAKVAHEARSASNYGIADSQPVVDMLKVREYIRQAIAHVYNHETPEELSRRGIEVISSEACFLNAHTIKAGKKTLSAKNFIITSGAYPVIPKVPGLKDVQFMTYEQIFDNDRLPQRMIVMGAGPIGMEIAQIYQRLGSQVTVIGERMLPKDEPEVAEVMKKVFAREGIKFIWSRATGVRKDETEIIVTAKEQEVKGEILFIAVGRAPRVEGLNLEKAGVSYSSKGIQIDNSLRTTAKHIYAAGDCIGGYQFTHFAGWQAFQAVRNALLIGSSEGFTDVVPWTTFTDPEVAHVGLTEEQARKKFCGEVKITIWDVSRIDRAICENDKDAFLKIVHKNDGKLLGATIVASRAGEAITEFVLALKLNLKLSDLAGAIHVYPTYSTAIQELAAEITVEDFLSSLSCRIIRTLKGKS